MFLYAFKYFKLKLRSVLIPLPFSDVLALPIFKQEDSSLPLDGETKHPPFQYVMCAATSPAVKLHDETLTYLNQGWYGWIVFCRKNFDISTVALQPSLLVTA